MFQPICPGLGIWFTYGSLITVIAIILFFVYVRNVSGWNFKSGSNKNETDSTLSGESDSSQNSCANSTKDSITKKN